MDTSYLALETVVTDSLEPNKDLEEKEVEEVVTSETIEEESQTEKAEDKKEKQKRYVATYAVFTQFVWEIVICIGGGVLLGVWLDKLLNTKCLFLLLFLFILGPIPFFDLIRRSRKDGKK